MSYTNGLDNPELYFQTKLYTGNGTSQSITLDGSENMQPDWVWIKERSSTSDHSLHDSVRGSTKIVKSSTNAAEITRTGSITSFDSDGFSLGDNAGVNENSQTYASWNWLAGGSASSNSNGSITSSVSASTTSGFSIVSYTGNGTGGATFGHGLGSAPKIVIIKCRSLGTESWQFWFNNTSRLNLNSTTASLTTHPISTSSTLVTTPSSSNDSWNTSGQTYISYCFAEKKGYSKFGSYTGNGNSDGTFVYTGFKPAFLITKCTSNSAFSNSNWMLYDNKRDLYNQMAEYLYPDSSNASGTNSQGMDFLSNGIKMRNTFGDANYNNETYIYMAFAENPFVNSNGVPTNAR